MLNNYVTKICKKMQKEISLHRTTLVVERVKLESKQLRKKRGKWEICP